MLNKLTHWNTLCILLDCIYITRPFLSLSSGILKATLIRWPTSTSSWKKKPPFVQYSDTYKLKNRLCHWFHVRSSCTDTDNTSSGTAVKSVLQWTGRTSCVTEPECHSHRTHSTPSWVNTQSHYPWRVASSPPPPTSKGAGAESLYTKSERLSQLQVT